MSRKPRGLRPDEEALWQQVARTATPLEPSKIAKSIETKPTPPSSKYTPTPFTVGSSSETAPAYRDIAPSVSKRVEATPLRMDKRKFSRMKRGKAHPEDRIDLHGMTAAAAHLALKAFLLRAYANDKRLVLVITGKGRQSADDGPIPTRTGVLRHQLPDWIAQAPVNQIVLQITQSHQKHGGAGAFYVYLARRR